MDRERWLAIVVRTGLIVFFVWMTQAILVPVMLGALFALLLAPLSTRLAGRLGKAQQFAPLIVTISAFVIFVVPFVFVTIEVVRSVNEFLARDWTATFNRLQGFLTGGFDVFGRRIHIGGPQIQSVLSNVGQRAASFLAGFVAGLATTVPNFIVALFLFVVSLYYFLRDGDRLRRWLFRASPFSENQTRELFSSVRETVNGAILGLIATSLVQGGLTLAALYIFGIPQAFLLGIAATLMSFLPLIGTTPVTFGAAIYLFVSGRYGAGVGMIVSAFIVGISDNVVRPWAQSSRGDMHPLLALLGIFGGIELFGASGVFIGPIVAAMAVWALDTYIRLYPRRDPPRPRPPGVPSETAPDAGERLEDPPSDTPSTHATRDDITPSTDVARADVRPADVQPADAPPPPSSRRSP
ncbi:AI-2E family transporter [Chondromyces apiculatus]|uniref:Permease n=1 Tax=Chondromyces apiculatus DSM 436 TaxID=1192034 RepID=A0A017TAQ1_9BACT|nr:AI-2E family transporter [Chondromyces apiculatus]EYF05982.1 Hypothetical protein CAP_2441 [Chondromyces apiculatus DSM 436]